MSLFKATNPVQGAALPLADATYVNFNRVALIEVLGTQVYFIFDTQFPVYIDFPDNQSALDYAASVVAGL